jgi:hypothetical protein
MIANNTDHLFLLLSYIKLLNVEGRVLVNSNSQLKLFFVCCEYFVPIVDWISM